MTVAALAATLGWVGDRLLKAVVTQLIPGALRAFPISAMLLSGALLGLIVLVYDLAPNLGQAALAPWLSLQLAAVTCLGHGGRHMSWYCGTCDAVVYRPPLNKHC